MKFPFEFSAENHIVEAEIIQGQVWLNFQGQTWCVDSAQNSTSKRTSHNSGPLSEVTAPMPGKIIKVAVQANQNVEAGQIVVIMEAMKMEYTLKADRAVRIENVKVQVGQQVRLGESLVTFAKDEVPT